MGARPDAATIAAYARDGAAVVRGAFAPHRVAPLAAGVERNLREPGPSGARYTPEGRPGLFFGGGRGRRVGGQALGASFSATFSSNARRCPRWLGRKARP